MRNVLGLKMEAGEGHCQRKENSRVSEGLWIPDRCVPMIVTVYNGKSLLI